MSKTGNAADDVPALCRLCTVCVRGGVLVSLAFLTVGVFMHRCRGSPPGGSAFRALKGRINSCDIVFP